MEKIDIDGVGIAYELLGDKDGQPIALTPGGRFTMDVPGLREMAEEFVNAGHRVLIYDRPNCGHSDTCLLGESESENQAEALAGLIKKLELGPTVITSGWRFMARTIIFGINSPRYPCQWEFGPYMLKGRRVTQGR